MTGEAEFNQMFFEDVRVPRENLLGPLNGGWGVALTTLMNERATLSLATVMRFQNIFQDLAELARRVVREGTCRLEPRLIRETLAQFYIDVESMKYLAYRNFSRLQRGGTPGPEGSISKLLWSELNQRMNEFAMVLQGPLAPLTEGSAMSSTTGAGNTRCCVRAAIRSKRAPRRCSAASSPSACCDCRRVTERDSCEGDGESLVFE